MLAPKKGRILSLDLGKRTTGVAVSDEEQCIAFPREDISHLSLEVLIQKLKFLVLENDIQLILIGLPIGLNGEETEQSLWTRETVTALKKELDQEILFVDERLSTVQGKSHSGAAKIILESFLKKNSKG